jgi:uncharacterized protein
MAAFAEGTPCWLDVSLPDLEAGKRFYGELFGWTFPPGPDAPAYAEALSDGSRVAALVAKRDGRMPTAWGVYFATPDAADAARRVVAAGGRMVREPVPVGRLGVVALAADPGGAVFGLWQEGVDEPAKAPQDEPLDALGDFAAGTPKGPQGPGAGTGPADAGATGSQPAPASASAPGTASSPASAAGTASTPGSAPASAPGTGFERQGSPGSFCWTEVYTRLPEPVDAFYERVLRVSGSDMPGRPGEDVPFRMWSPKGATPGPDTAIGGRSVMTDAFPAELPGHFLNYFAVTDCDAAAAAVVRLGGRVRQRPFDIPNGRMAVFTDNQGADFAVLAERTPGSAAAGAERAEAGEGRGKAPGPGSGEGRTGTGSGRPERPEAPAEEPPAAGGPRRTGPGSSGDGSGGGDDGETAAQAPGAGGARREREGREFPDGEAGAGRGGGRSGEGQG